MEISSIILGFAFLQSLHLAFYFLLKDRPMQDKAGFVFFFIFLAFTFFCNFLYISGLIKVFIHFSQLGYLLGVLAPPLFLLGISNYYRLHLFSPQFAISAFLPSIALGIYQLPFFFSDTETKHLFLNANQADLVQGEPFQLMLYVLISNFIFLSFFSYRLFRVKSSFDELGAKQSLQISLWILVVWHLIGICIYALHPSRTEEAIINIGFSFWTIGLSYFRLITDQREFKLKQQKKSEDKYKKSLLVDDKLQKAGMKIEAFFSESDRIFDSDFSFEELSIALGHSNHDLSQVFNRYFQKTFYEYLREKRIEKALEYLSTTDWTVLRIGMEVGYESKSAFLRAFRQIKSVSPKEYKQKLQSSSI